MKWALSFLFLSLMLVLVGCQNTPSTSQSGMNQAPAANSAPKTEEAAKPAPAVTEVEVPEGTVVRVRLDQALSTVRNKQGDTFTASLDEPVAVNGIELLPKGTKFTGRVTTADSSGRLKGRGALGIILESFELRGETYKVDSSLDTRTTEDHKKRNIEMIGGGTGVGALIGAIAGRGKGAAIGAAAGAAAGTGTAAATGKKEVEVPAETVFKFTLKNAVMVKG